MKNKIANKLAKLPVSPGVYFFKNAEGEIIYVGKAARLRNRVRSYFQKGRPHDTKTSLLVADIASIDWQEVESEDDALFLEAELVRRYRPRYNILLRDDKSSQYVRIDYKSDHPTVNLVRRPLPDGAEYFGPYTDGWAVKQSLRFLRRAFPYATSNTRDKRVKLQYYLGLDPGLEENRTSLEDYRANLRKLMRYLRGGRTSLVKQMEKEMNYYARKSEFEAAAKVRDQLKSLAALNRRHLLSSQELAESNRDHALSELSHLLGLSAIPKRIDGFDISHIQGSDNSASMVVFVLGVPDKTAYRKFKLKVAGNDDFAHMAEAISRRLSEGNVKKWGKPDFILIDGGRGQLAAALRSRDDAGYSKIPMVGLAKADERVVIKVASSIIEDPLKIIARATKLKAYVTQSGDFVELRLPENSPALKLLQRIRDESHRFALSYHSGMRAKRQVSSWLDELPGVGPATRKKLIREYGSLKAARAASLDQLQASFGQVRGQRLFNQFRALPPS